MALKRRYKRREPRATDARMVMTTGSGAIPIVQPTISYRSTPVRVPQDYATLQDACDAELGSATWESSLVSIGTCTSVVGSEVITGSGTSFLTDIEPEDFILHGGQYYAVRDVTSDTSLRLWKGASSAVIAQAFKRVPTFVTIITELADNDLSTTVPDGVSLQIVGSNITNKLNTNGVPAITHGQLASVELHNLTLNEGVGTHILTQGFGTTGPRGVLRMSQLTCIGESVNGYVLFSGSAAIISDIVAFKWKANIICDYCTVTNVSTTNLLDDDVMLIAIADIAADVAYSCEVADYTCYKADGSIGNFNGGLEWNQWAATKVVNVSDSQFYNKGVTVQAGNDSYPIWAPTVGTVNFTDCIIDSDSVVEEIFNRGATINFTRTTKLDGVTLPRLSP